MQRPASRLEVIDFKMDFLYTDKVKYHSHNPQARRKYARHNFSHVQGKPEPVKGTINAWFTAAGKGEMFR
jgi:hypothetical protein